MDKIFEKCSEINVLVLMIINFFLSQYVDFSRFELPVCFNCLAFLKYKNYIVLQISFELLWVSYYMSSPHQSFCTLYIVTWYLNLDFPMLT